MRTGLAMRLELERGPVLVVALLGGSGQGLATGRSGEWKPAMCFRVDECLGLQPKG